MLIGGLVNSLLSSRNDRKNTERTIAGQKELSQYAFSQNQTMATDAYNRDVAMWERQNAYNDPQSQMSRLQAAKLNPNLVYGSGSATGNQSGPPPSFNPAEYKAPDIQYRFSPMQIPEVLSAYQDFQMKKAQVDQVRAVTQATRMRTLSETFGLTRSKELFPHQLSILEQEGEQAWYGTRNAQREMQRRGLQNMLMRGEVDRLPLVQERMFNENLYSRYRNEWMKAGVTSSDHILFRVMSRMWNESGLSVSNIRRKLFGK